MRIVSCGEWTFEVDVEATEEYYRRFSVDPNNKVYRNFKKNFEEITEEEMHFFRSFGIDPLCFNVNVDDSGISIMSGSGHHLFFGKRFEGSETDLTENTIPYNPIITLRGLGCYVGRFTFTFHDKDTRWPEIIPDDMPDGCICIHTQIELPWLLRKREGKGIVQFPLEKWQVLKRLRKHMKRRSANRSYDKKAKETFENALKQMNIEYTVMSRREVSSYMKQWFMEYLPPYADEKEMERLCLSGGEYCPLLWHMFTYGGIGDEEGDRAKECFDEQEKGECVILLENLQLGFIVKDGSRLTSEAMDLYEETYVTAKDYSWSYVHTHEDGWIGPFFHCRDVKK